jgi:hypothetical protein
MDLETGDAMRLPETEDSHRHRPKANDISAIFVDCLRPHDAGGFRVDTGHLGALCAICVTFMRRADGHVRFPTLHHLPSVIESW